MAATRSPLRRWERFFPAFAAIDDAVEAVTGHPRGEFRSVRTRIVTLLRAAADDGVAEELCAALDAVMEEALATLRVAASAPPESTGLTKLVIALSVHHESTRVRSLAGDVVRRWTAAAEAVVVGAIRFMEVVNKHTKEPRILRGSAVVVAERARGRGRGCDARDAADEDKERYAPPAKTKMAIDPANGSVAVKVAAPLLNKKPKGKMEENAEARRKTPAGGNRVESEEMMAQASRGLPTGGGCETSTEDSGHRGAVAPKMSEQRQKKMHPILRETSRARCGSSSAVRRSLLPSLQRI